jgi:hypothetical protein
MSTPIPTGAHAECGVTGPRPNAEVGVDVDAPRLLERLCSRSEAS